MLDEAHGLSVFYLRKAHPLNISLLSHIHLLLLRANHGGRKDGVRKIIKINRRRNVSITTESRQELLLILTFDTRKQKAESLVLAFSGSTTNRPFSSSRHRYRPVVMWRIRKDWPHFMWLPLQLQAENLKKNQNYILKACVNKHVSTLNIDILIGQTPDSERLQPPQGPSLTANSAAFIVSHPVEESGAHRGIRC